MAVRELSRVAVCILNIVHMIIGLALAATALFFFVQVYEVTSLRNSNHYLLDYNVYWPQAIPWLFFFAGLYAVFASALGFYGLRKKSRGVIRLHAICLLISLAIMLTVAILALVCADSNASDSFLKDTIWDAFQQGKDKPEIDGAFSLLERKYQCCGADSPRDYKSYDKYSSIGQFPSSCCDTYFHSWVGQYPLDCDMANKTPNERHGCTKVTSQYARIAVKVMAGATIFLGLIDIVCFIVSVALWKMMRHRKPKAMTEQDEVESKKILY